MRILLLLAIAALGWAQTTLPTSAVLVLTPDGKLGFATFGPSLSLLPIEGTWPQLTWTTPVVPPVTTKRVYGVKLELDAVSGGYIVPAKAANVVVFRNRMRVWDGEFSITAGILQFIPPPGTLSALRVGAWGELIGSYPLTGPEIRIDYDVMP